MKHRFNSIHRPMDWAILLQDLSKHMSYKDIGEIVGRSRASVTSMANDLQTHPEEWDNAFALIDLWIRVSETNKLPVK